VQAHTLGEGDVLGIVLLRVSSGTILTIFIEIGSYLTDREQKISWHSFFETRCSALPFVLYSVSPDCTAFLKIDILEIVAVGAFLSANQQF